MDKYRQANQNLWNAKTEYHIHSEYYDLEGFKAGAESLYPIELEELAPEVAGKTLLHGIGTDKDGNINAIKLIDNR